MLILEKIMNKFIWAAAIAVYPSVCNAMTGNELLEMSSKDTYAAIHYVQAVVDTIGFDLRKDQILAEYEGRGLPQRHYVCLPKGSTYGQAYEIIIQYLKDNPGSRHDNASELSFYALLKVWRCAE
jgi:hypothetical protein